MTSSKLTKKKGRPTIYTKELGEEICYRLADGESLRNICKDKYMPDRVNVSRWILAIDNPIYDDFRNQYTLARQMQYENLADEIIDIADDGTNDYIERIDQGNKGYEFNGEAVGRSRLRVDTRKWFLSKVLTKFKDKPEKKTTNDMASVLQSLIDKLPN